MICVGWSNDAWMWAAYLINMLCDSGREGVQFLTWFERQQQIRQDHLETSALCEFRQWGEQTVSATCLSIHPYDYILYRSAHRARQELQCCSFITVFTAKRLQFSFKMTGHNAREDHFNTMRCLNIWHYRDVSEIQLCESRIVYFIILISYNSTCIRWCYPSS